MFRAPISYQYRLGLGVRFMVRVCIYVYGAIQLILTFTILVRETWNDYPNSINRGVRVPRGRHRH
jgi:hypothetical protein